MNELLKDYLVIIRDDKYDEIYSQTFYEREDDFVYNHANKLAEFFEGTPEIIKLT